ncbi:unnamed protein product [Discula destructiva]
MPSKERPESVHAMGKAFFHRKSKLRKESLTGALLTSADFTSDMATDRSRAASSISKDHILSSMSIFSRRKTVVPTPEEPAQKKPMISTPYNFQHVTQIHRDQLADLERGDRNTLHSDLRGLPSTPPALGDDLRVPNFASGRTRYRDDEDSVPPHVVLHNPESSTSRPPSMHKSHPKQWVKQTQAPDHPRGHAPPRPPRSPTQLNMGYFDYVPPVALQNPGWPSVPRRDSEALGNTMPGMQQSTSSSRYPHPLQAQDGPSSTIPTSPGPPSPFTQDRRFSRLITPTETPNWPLSASLHNSSVTTLPEVPEEEELCGLPSRSRPSTQSSLRGSISVPALRKSSLSSASYTSHDRTFSRDSVVLGTFDMSAYRQSAEDDVLNRAQTVDPLRRDSWEAVIDYCYEHEMEADCDYDWHRSSLDLDQEPAVLVTESGDDNTVMSRPPSESIELPVLSPSHHLSPRSSEEVITPSLACSTKSPTKANFSLPRRERPQPQRLLHVRKESQISFTEAQGFSLSPSFLIPTDYHQELLAAQLETRMFQNPDAIAQAVTLEDSALAMDGSGLFVAARASASTTASNSNLSSQSVSERHISSTSTNTDYTNLAMSVNSVDTDGFNFKDETSATTSSEAQEPKDAVALAATHARSHSAAGLLGGAKSPSLVRATHCSDSNLARMQSPSLQKAAAGGRARSRTLSSTPGNFSLFPPVTKAPPRC